MSIRFYSMLFSAVMLIGLVGCSPENTDEVETADVVVTDGQTTPATDMTSDGDDATKIKESNEVLDDDLNVVVEKDVK